jgi:hypothetical protein
MAHPYSTDSSERETVPLYLAGAAIASALALGWIFATLKWLPPAWIDAPSTIAFYGFYYQLFRVWVWKWPLLRAFGIVKIPKVAGEWTGRVITTYDEQHGKHDVHVSIQQNWTDMRLLLKTPYSQSTSLIGAILIRDRIILSYEYLNEPLPNAVGTMHAHRGSARLILSDDGMSLDGDYYTGRDRTNYGSLSLKKVQS